MRAVLLGALLLASTAASAFDLQGHRGARGLAPENTLPAFATALSTGVTTLELDVGITRDGAVVVTHDRTLNPDVARGADGAYVTAPGPTIRSLTLEELRRYDVGALNPGSKYAGQYPQQRPAPGARVPTLEEVVALVGKAGNQTVRFNIETKLSPLAPDETLDPESFATAVVKAVRDLGIAQRSTIQSFDWRTLKHVQKIAPEIPTVCLTIDRGRNDNVQRGRPDTSPWTAGLDIDDVGGSVPLLVQKAGCKIWSPFFRDATKEAVAEAKRLGLPVVVWTVNEPADMEAVIALGVDGIISDYPDRVRTVATAKGLKLPAPTPVAP